MPLKLRMLLAVYGVATVLAPAFAQAEPRRECYRFSDFAEYVDLIVNDAVGRHILVYGRWVQLNALSGGVTGAFERKQEAPGRRFSLSGTLGDATSMLVVFLEATPNGQWRVRWINSAGSVGSSQDSPFQKVSCSNPLGAAAARGGYVTDPGGRR